MNSQKATRLDFQAEKYRFIVLRSLLLSFSLVFQIIISVAKINKANLHLVLHLNIASSHLFLSFSARLKTSSDRYFRDILTWFNYVTLWVFWQNTWNALSFALRNKFTPILSPMLMFSVSSVHPHKLLNTPLKYRLWFLWTQQKDWYLMTLSSSFLRYSFWNIRHFLSVIMLYQHWVELIFKKHCWSYKVNAFPTYVTFVS